MVALMDWIALAVLLASLLLGMWRGLVYESMSVGGWVLAFFMARWTAQAVGQWLPMGDAQEQVRYAAGFVLVFVGVAFLGGTLAWAVRGLARALGMRPVDRVFGAVFGLLRGVLLLLVLGLVLQWTQLDAQPWWRESVTAVGVQFALGLLQPWLPPMLLPALAVPNH